MQNLKLNLSSFLVLLLVSTIAISTLPSCKKDKSGCTDPLAENYDNDADKDDGNCVYAREKFLGTYACTETCTSGTYSWSMTITESSSDVQAMILQNLGDFGENVRATASGSSLAINDTQNGLIFSGTGTINGTALTINYMVSGAFDDNCAVSGVKQ